MPANTDANNPVAFTFQNPPVAEEPAATTAGTIRPVSACTPLNRKDPSKRPKALALEQYLAEDIELPPSPTRAKSSSSILLGADILTHLHTEQSLSSTSSSTSSHKTSTAHTAPPNMADSTNTLVTTYDAPHGITATHTAMDQADASIPEAVRSRLIAHPGPKWFTIYGQTHDRILKPIALNHQRDWLILTGFKVLAVVSRLKVTRNPGERVAAMMAIESVLSMVFPGNVAIDVCIGDTIGDHVHPNSAYPFLIQGLTEGQALLLTSEFCLAMDAAAIFFYPHNTPSRLPTMPAEIARFLSVAGEFIQFITAHHDNIPFEAEPNPNNFVRWTLSTLRVTSSLVRRRNGPIPVHKVLHPPTLEATAYKQWIELLHKLQYDTRKGTRKPTTAELCNVCKSVGHPEDQCPYAAIPGWPTAPPAPPSPPQAQTYNGHSGGFSRGRGRGGNPGRGRGNSTSTGWA
ncbi:hypothetical protein M422DRAFT_246203 [Sphaerobolus stellatus SS14]|nr:hypothetical protein M422DRAFT_246203 [Sphaerobolus stellatus SS14]